MQLFVVFCVFFKQAIKISYVLSKRRRSTVETPITYISPFNSLAQGCGNSIANASESCANLSHCYNVTLSCANVSHCYNVTLTSAGYARDYIWTYTWGELSSVLWEFIIFVSILEENYSVINISTDPIAVVNTALTSNVLAYLVGSFSQVFRNRDTQPWPRPLMMANMELKFLHSLQWPEKKRGKSFLYVQKERYTMNTELVICPKYSQKTPHSSRAMGCVLWVQSVIYVLLLSLQCCM